MAFKTLLRSLVLLLAVAGTVRAQTETILDNPYPSQSALFGADVDISGSRMIIGAPGGQAGTSAFSIGEAVIYEQTNGVWTEMDRISPAFPVFQRFGNGVAIDGDRAIAGTFGFGNFRGGVAVFEYANGTWSQTASIYASDAADNDALGYQVALDGDRIVASAPGDDQYAGSVYVFDLVGGSWTQTARLTAPTPVAGEVVGASLDFDGFTIVAGAPGQIPQGSSGKAVVWQNNGTSWYPYEISSPSAGTYGRFGESVAVESSQIVVGAPSRTGYNTQDGAAYVFEQIGNPWLETAQIEGGASYEYRQFGYRVALSDDRLAISSISSIIRTQPGDVAVYEYDGFGWTPEVTVAASDADVTDIYGYGLALEDADLVVGAYAKDAGATDAGSVYVYDLDGPPASTPFLLASDGITVGKADVLVGDLHSNAGITLQRQALGYAGSYTSSLTAVGAIDIDRRNILDGSVSAGGTFSIHPSATVSGSTAGGAFVSAIPLPTPVAVTPGAQNVTVGAGQTQSLLPSSYKRLRIEGEMVLSAGTYDFDQLLVRPGGVLTLDVTNGPVTIDVQTKVLFAQDAEVRAASGGVEDEALSDHVTINSAQASNLIVGARAQVVGSINAPLALVRFAANASFVGAASAREIEVKNGTSMRAHGASAPAFVPPSLASLSSSTRAASAVAIGAGPNPFSARTTLTVDVPTAGDVLLTVHDALGREVDRLIDGALKAGSHTTAFEAGDLPAGVYLVRLTTPGETVTRRLTHVR